MLECFYNSSSCSATIGTVKSNGSFDVPTFYTTPSPSPYNSRYNYIHDKSIEPFQAVVTAAAILISLIPAGFLWLRALTASIRHIVQAVAVILGISPASYFLLLPFAPFTATSHMMLRFDILWELVLAGFIVVGVPALFLFLWSRCATKIVRYALFSGPFAWLYLVSIIAVFALLDTSSRDGMIGWSSMQVVWFGACLLASGIVFCVLRRRIPNMPQGSKLVAFLSYSWAATGCTLAIYLIGTTIFTIAGLVPDPAIYIGSDQLKYLDNLGAALHITTWFAIAFPALVTGVMAHKARKHTPPTVVVFMPHSNDEEENIQYSCTDASTPVAVTAAPMLTTVNHGGRVQAHMTFSSPKGHYNDKGGVALIPCNQTTHE